jgi:hypothetical protein
MTALVLQYEFEELQGLIGVLQTWRDNLNYGPSLGLAQWGSWFQLISTSYINVGFYNYGVLGLYTSSVFCLWMMARCALQLVLLLMKAAKVLGWISMHRYMCQRPTSVDDDVMILHYSLLNLGQAISGGCKSFGCSADPLLSKPKSEELIESPSGSKGSASGMPSLYDLLLLRWLERETKVCMCEGH